MMETVSGMLIPDRTPTKPPRVLVLVPECRCALRQVFCIAFILLAGGLYWQTSTVVPVWSGLQKTGYQGARDARETRTGLKKYAYVTLLCDDIMADAALVLVHSVKRTGTPHDVVVLAMHTSNRTIDALHTLGAKVVQIADPVAYPFAVTADRLAINKPCRYSKLLVWNMVQYKKIVYLDGDLLVIRNIDELFERPQLSAVPDSLPPDKFNSGLIVLEPNRATFKDMIKKVATTVSPNVGDQGFLNSYFHDWYKRGNEYHLHYGYNALLRNSASPAWKHFVEPKLKVLHFSGKTKPWNMMVDKQFPSTRQYDYMWWQVYDGVYGTLGRMALEHSRGNSSKLPQQLSPECQRDYMAYSRGLVVKDKISVVMNCFDRFDLLTYFIRRYASLEFVHKIYVVWGNTQVPPFQASYFNVSKPIEILYSGMDSLNDRFKPIPSLETEAVLICDDDIEVNVEALRIALDRWKEDPYRLVGFFPRAHYRDRRTKQLVYVQGPQQAYSMVLTKMFLMHGDYLRWYTCSIPQELRDYLDLRKNCEDITMNFLVSQLSGLPPLLVEDITKVDYGTSSGLSSRGSHDVSRSVCMNDIEGMLGSMHLRNTTETVTYFHRDSTIHISQQRRRAADVAELFQPILAPQKWRARQEFMAGVLFLHRHAFADVATIPSESTGRTVLCIQGNNQHNFSDTSTNRYALLAHSSIPRDATQMPGTTFLLHSPQGFKGRFTLLSLLSTFLSWKVEHGCFGPSRVLLYKGGLVVPTPSAFSRMVLLSLLGQTARPFSPAGRHTPVCFESAVVARQREPWDQGACSAGMNSTRRVVHAFCRSLPRQSAPPEDNPANVRIRVLGDADNWRKVPWFSFPQLEEAVRRECSGRGLSCQTVVVPSGKFCRDKVLAMSQADIVIGPWLDHAMDSVVFLRPGSAVLEVLPLAVPRDEREEAQKQMLCLDLRYEQLNNDCGMDPLIAWVKKHLVDLRRESTFLEEEPSLVEQCVTRDLQYY